MTWELLLKSLNHAREYTDITDEEIEIILACMKSVLADNRRTWVKSHVDNLDVPMDAYNSAQVADLIMIYILDTLGRIVNLDRVRLYRDDRIIFIPDSNGPKTSKIQKKIIRAFKLLDIPIYAIYRYLRWEDIYIPRLRNQTALSKYFWNLKDQELTPQIKWKIFR